MKERLLASLSLLRVLEQGMDGKIYMGVERHSMSGVRHPLFESRLRNDYLLLESRFLMMLL